MNSLFDFIVGVLNATAWPAVVFFAYYVFRVEIRSVFGRLLSGEMFGAKFHLQSQREYIENVKSIGDAKSEKERSEIQQNLIQPKNEDITKEEGAKLVSEEILEHMDDKFSLSDFKNGFDGYFSSEPGHLDSNPIKQFKILVIEKLRESKRVIERNENGQLSYRKVTIVS